MPGKILRDKETSAVNGTDQPVHLTIAVEKSFGLPVAVDPEMTSQKIPIVTNARGLTCPKPLLTRVASDQQENTSGQLHYLTTLVPHSGWRFESMLLGLKALESYFIQIGASGLQLKAEIHAPISICRE